MNPDEIEAALKVAFFRCDTASCPLTEQQKNILVEAVKNSHSGASNSANPLEELTSEELELFLQFVKSQEEQNFSWKAQLLNDWLHNRNSQQVQFIRDRYGVQWLYRLEPHHFNQFKNENIFQLKIGDRIQVCNALWEWVQENGVCPPEWFSCTVVKIDEVGTDEYPQTDCIIRFDDDNEYVIQGIYEWNRYNWRWLEKSG
ncbi:MAG: hypothetical protein AAFX80_09150 [Cyanobacteria bacterium J06639_18]